MVIFHSYVKLPEGNRYEQMIFNLNILDPRLILALLLENFWCLGRAYGADTPVWTAKLQDERRRSRRTPVSTGRTWQFSESFTRKKNLKNSIPEYHHF